jgi:hypothetical protein
MHLVGFITKKLWSYVCPSCPHVLILLFMCDFFFFHGVNTFIPIFGKILLDCMAVIFSKTVFLIITAVRTSHLARTLPVLL